MGFFVRTFLAALVIWGGLPMVGSLALASAGDPRLTAVGEALFKQKCTCCHAINGEGGRFGPDLGQVGTRRNRGYLEAKLRNPKKTNPASVMPTFGDLPKEQFEALLQYLEWLK